MKTLLVLPAMLAVLGLLVPSAALTPPPTPDPAPPPSAQAAASPGPDAPLVLSLAGAVVKVNGELKKSTNLDRADIMGMFQGVYTVRASLRESRQEPDGSLRILGETRITRPVVYRSAAAARELQSAQRSVREAEEKGNAALRQFDSLWRPQTRRINGRDTRIYTRPGCQKVHRPMNEQQHATRRGEIFTSAKSAVDGAKRRLEETRERHRTQEQEAVVRARTVELVILAPADAPEAALLRRVGEVPLEVRVVGITTATDPPEIAHGAAYVAELHLAPAWAPAPPKAVQSAASQR